MDEVKSQEFDLKEFLKPRCPVSVGDRIYRKYKVMTIPDRLEVVEIIPNETGYFIKCRYMYHGIGVQERTFSDVIFRDDSWVIEKKGVDF